VCVYFNSKEKALIDFPTLGLLQARVHDRNYVFCKFRRKSEFFLLDINIISCCRVHIVLRLNVSEELRRNDDNVMYVSAAMLQDQLKFRKGFKNLYVRH